MNVYPERDMPEVRRSVRRFGIGLLSAFIVCSALWLSLGWAEAGRLPATATPRAPAPAVDVRVAGDASHPQLYIDHKLVFDRPGSHLGRPRVSPDGRLVAVTVVPAGTETHRYGQVYLFSAPEGRLVTTVPGYNPLWQADSRRLEVTRPGGRVIFDVATRNVMADPDVGPQHAQSTVPALVQSAPLTYPTTIRVAHHPENACRNVPDWQVDVIPFEEYVARSVPAEVPSRWPLEALAAQAVAARTYAWYQILQGRKQYDVTDWANFQMMCDDRYPDSDQAVAMTAGQYLSYVGDPSHRPIIAMYSARNGHPTLDHPTVPYLRAVPDETALGKSRWGHGYGLSQWGAALRARNGQTYGQILGHYYTDVALQNAQNPQQPVGALLGVYPGGFLPPGGLRWRTLAPYLQLPARVELASQYGLTRTWPVTSTQLVTYTSVITHSSGLTDTVILSDSVLITQTMTATGTLSLPGRGVWQRHLALGEAEPVTVTLFLSDTQQDQMLLWLDRTPPASPVLTAPVTSEIHSVTLAFRAGPGAQTGLSNVWRWEGEMLLRTPNTGRVISDTAASGGAVLGARRGQDSPGVWYGPYATGIPAKAAYRAVFRLRIGEHPDAQRGDGILPDKPVARLDVADQGGSVQLGLRDVWASDFSAPDQFQDIPVDFYIFEPLDGLETRVEWYGDVDLDLDRVQIWQLQPLGATGPIEWPLMLGPRPVVEAIAFDAAGNASQLVSQTVTIVDAEPPVFIDLAAPEGWQTTLPLTVSVGVSDPGSGLDGQSGQLLLDGKEAPVQLSDPGNPWAPQQLTGVMQELADGVHVGQFRIADRAGAVAVSAPFTVAVDLTAPVITGTAVLSGEVTAPAVNGWFSDTVQIHIESADATSGVAGIAFVLDGAPFQMYDGPFPVGEEGEHVVRYWAQDGAGNYTRSHYLFFGIDRSSPAVQITARPMGRDQARVQWSGEDALSGVKGYRVQVRRDGGAWSPLQASGTFTESTQADIPFSGAEVMDVRVQAVDLMGHASSWNAVEVRPANVEIFLPTILRP